MGSSGIVPELLKFEFLEVILEFPLFLFEFKEVGVVVFDFIVGGLVSGTSSVVLIVSQDNPEGIHFFLNAIDLIFKTFNLGLIVVHDSGSVFLSFFSGSSGSVSLLLCESSFLDSVLVVPFVLGKDVPVLLFFDSAPGLISTLLILSPEVKILFGIHEVVPHLVLRVVFVVEFRFIIEG
jgi:hypothetical protein